MIIRIRAIDGTKRITLDPKQPAIDLIKAVEATCKISRRDFRLYFDPGFKKVLTGNPKSSITKFGLEHGQMLFLKPTKEARAEVFSSLEKSYKPVIKNNGIDDGKSHRLEELEKEEKKEEPISWWEARMREAGSNLIQSVGKEVDDIVKLQKKGCPDGIFGKGTKDLGMFSFEARCKLPISHQDQPITTSVSVSNNVSLFLIQHLQRKKYTKHVFAWVFGKFNDADGTATVEALHFPAQSYTPEGGVRLHDISDRDETANMVAGMLGLRQVGILVTHPIRHSPVYDSEILECARKQAKHDPRCVFISVSTPDEEMVAVALDNGLTIREAGDVEFECFQGSEQAVGLARHEFLSLLDDNPMLIRSDLDCIVEGKPTKEINVAMLTTPVPIVKHDGILHCEIPPSVFSDAGIDPGSICALLSTKGHEPVYRRYADFELLVTVCPILDGGMSSGLLQSIKEQDIIPSVGDGSAVDSTLMMLFGG
ncbi:Nuclear protein localization protein 4 like protein [Aduncisulcus paluster]|uniref:Nuclear protein localization protein 4 like protein n=1 Tax=Aduncisulcus paluster TaxID=2918883 RepID=A0ABQ5KG39_9EUKA|nr:Nuclear protein localization protein 4 like protein [Aduncisulcus paluster]|eukprot:gnl/Carplike_NY0171/2797_a3757_622.p1 GENE.gnl/Carplike_NY0171/2797_a3757_622~~gnl/Carplike_NY0171/2797_a3757_622.p1  ORF type:complete len:481 (+),score=116.67 gnl/Carplike_NY0171/2797_a3757_622:11-1453(+)